MDAEKLEEIPSWSDVPRNMLHFAGELKKITYDEIKDILIKRHLHWSQIGRTMQNDPDIVSEFERELVVTESLSQYGTAGAVLFAVNGSPPRGYALYITDFHHLCFYESFGKRFLIMDGVFVIDGDGGVFERLKR